MSNFVNLHNHTTFSLLDGLCKVEDLIQATVNAKMNAVAITDHGSLFGAIDFYKTAMKAGVKPIIGMEAYVSKESIETGTRSGIKNSYNHLVLLAKNMTGYKNLVKLASIAYEKGFYYKPRIDEKYLQEYAEGLVCTSACIKGIIPELLLNDKIKEAEDKTRQYKDIFGDDFYIELQDHGIDAEIIVKERLKELARKIGVKMIITNDGHYMKKEHAKAHEVMLCIQTKTTMADPKRFKLSTQELYFKDRAELEELFSDVPEAFEHTVEIADKCNVMFEFGKLNLPKYVIPEDFDGKGSEDYLTKMCLDRLSTKVEITEAYEKRLEYELSIINKMHFSDYFLVVNDFIDFAKKHEIPVGPGRGSAAGSLVSYALGITNLDPLAYDLLFERFLNPERISMPDIDIDFCYERRDEVINYVKDHYGEDCVAQIITFGKMKAKAAIRDVGRVLDIPYDDVDRLAKLVPDTIGIKLKDALSTSTELKEQVETNPQYKKIFEFAEIMEGMERHSSVHAAGIVISPEPITNFLPLHKDPKTGKLTTQFSMNHIEDMGLLKMDFLGLRTLTVIHDCVALLEKRDIEINIDTIPFDDKSTYELFSKGDTIGVFQFESRGMRDYLRKLKPESVEDLTAMNALYRPGPLGNNMVDDFIHRKHGISKIEYIHPTLEPILKETYGVIVYQEQVMKIANDVAGFSLGKADLLRKAMGKKNMQIMQEMQNEFVQGAVGNKVDEKTAQKLFDHISIFAGYGFNKSHSAAYSYIAYQTAYLKANYPAEFMAANLTSEMDNTDRIVVLLEECRKMNIPILPPDVKTSSVKFSVEDGKIRFGLGAIKNVGSAAMDKLLEERSHFINARNFFEFCEHVDSKTINKKVLESFVKSGALDSLEGTRSQKFAAIEVALNFAHMSQSDREKGQTNIFEGGGEDQQTIEEFPPLPDVEEWSQSELLGNEKDVLGFYVSGHPLDKFKDEIRDLSTKPILELENLENDSQVRCGGIVTTQKVIQTRRNQSMAFISIEDYTGTVEIVLFADQYAKYRDLIDEDKMIFIKGKLSKKEEGKPKILAEEIYPIEQVREIFANKVLLSLTAQGLEQDTLDSINGLVRKHRGQCNLFFEVKTSFEERLVMKSNKFKIKSDEKTISAFRELLGTENVRIAV